MYDSNQAQMQAIGQAIVPPPRPAVTIMGLLPELGQEIEALDSAIDRLRSAVSPALRALPPAPELTGGLQAVVGEPPIVEGLQEFIRRARDLRRQVDDIGQRLAL